jgi:hypothetical protein
MVVNTSGPRLPPKHEFEDPVIAVCDTHEVAQAVVEKLHRAGWDMASISLVGKGTATPEQAHGFFAIGDRVKAWASAGSLWGAGWGLLLGAAIVVMPPLGVVAVAGPLVTILLAVLEGAAVVGGVSAIAAALAEIGMPSKDAADYAAHVREDRFLVIVHGSSAEVARARAVIGDTWPDIRLP